MLAAMPTHPPPHLPPGSLAGRPFPTLDGTGLTLREWTPGDAPDVMAAFAVPDIQRWNRRRIDDLDEAGQLIAGWVANRARETGLAWAITDDEGLLGRIALRGLSLAEGLGVFGYWVLPRARGRGVATTALELVSAWAFDDLGLHRLELAHSVANPASCRVAERAGFVLEGTLRGALAHDDGWHDMHVHGRVVRSL